MAKRRIPRKYVIGCGKNVVAVYDKTRSNGQGEPYCVVSGIPKADVPMYWKNYLKEVS